MPDPKTINKVLSPDEWAFYTGAVEHEDTLAIQIVESLAAERIRSEERRKMLEKHEWMPSTDDCVLLSDDPPNPILRCPSCWNTKDEGHAPDCDLARLVKEDT